MKNSSIKYLILLVIIVNSIGLFFPISQSTFAPYYASIAKHIVLNHNWTDLVLLGKPWLDKPHLPFWLSAISFKIWGINSFAYMLPGFLFNLLGAYYTYRLGYYLYNKETGLLASLFYLSSLHILLSAIDVRAEAYLVGEIMPAAYYWLKYDRFSKIKYLCLGAFFTSLALMTKGIFTLITITSGLCSLWLYQKRIQNFIKPKWLIALILIAILILPELIALYQQFDINPEITVFNSKHVSGIKWFLWDSQFGRFLNNGPIMTVKPDPYHWLFFVHTLLWAYLPWWPLFFYSVYLLIKSKISSNAVYLLSSFFVTFLLFSATTFQVDHYINIIFPFASIICAVGFLQNSKKSLYPIQIFIAILLVIVALIISYIVLNKIFLVLLLITIPFTIIKLKHNFIKLNIFAISTLFVIVMLINGLEYIKYDAGYKIAKYLNTQKEAIVIGYSINLMSLNFHVRYRYMQVYSETEIIDMMNKNMFLVVPAKQLDRMKKILSDFIIIGEFENYSIEGYLSQLLNKNTSDKYIIIKKI